MKIELTHEESEEYFLNALCNGLSEMSGYGLGIDYDAIDYINAKEKLQSPSSEDVLMQILRDGGRITMVDVEGEGDMTRSINLKNVHERVQNTPIDHLNAMIEEYDDAITADVILQTVFFGEIIFG